jgi:hypothetical protein
MIIELQNLGAVVASCWERAEETTRQAVAEKYSAPGEEQVTFLFGGELRAAVTDASNGRQFEAAFLEDLQREFHDIATDSLSNFNGLIARVNLHNRWHEGRYSASDLGVVIRRPFVQRVGAYEVEIVQDQCSALLAQAKLGRPDEKHEGRMKWGKLTKKQATLIPTHQDYYALLLYRLAGTSGNDLSQFGWQLCRNHSVPKIKAWLRDDRFPEEIRSRDMIWGLSAGVVGTGSESVIERCIDPQNTRAGAIEIHVFWPPGEGPLNQVSLQHEARVEVHVLA